MRKRPRLDLSRSLNQMLGYRDVHDDTTGLTARYTRAMRAPARSLDVAQIELLLNQGPTDDERSLIVAIAVERLAADFFGWNANLLLVDVARHQRVLSDRPELRRRAVEIVVSHADALAAYDGLRREEAVRAAMEIIEHDPAALVALECAFSRAGDRESTGRVQQRRLRAAGDLDARVAVLREIARELEPHDPIEAAYAWLDVLGLTAGDEEASAAAERLFTRFEEWSVVIHVLEGRAEARLLRGDRSGALADLDHVADLAATRADSPELLERTHARIARLRGA